MNFRISLSNVLLLLLALSLGIAWQVDSYSKRIDLDEILSNQEKLVVAKDRLQNSRVEYEHYKYIARNSLGSITLALDAQSRKFQAERMVLEIEKEIDVLKKIGNRNGFYNW